MSDLLSQGEIDALLRSLMPGAEPSDEPDDNANHEPDKSGEKQVHPYNFKLANKFSKEQLRTIDIVFDNYAQSMGNYLAGVMRSVCSVRVFSVEEVAFRDYFASLPEPVLLAVINQPPLEGSSLMHFSPQVAYSIISHIFGGQGALSKVNKPFTEIELATLTRIIRQLLVRMGEAWTRVASVNPSLERVETSPQFAQIVNINDAVAIVSLEVTIAETVDFVSVCIPHMSIEPIAKMLSTKLWYSTSVGRDIIPQGDVIRERLLVSKVNMRAVFRPTSASVRDIISLQVGDVIRLNHRLQEPLSLKIEQLPKFHGYIGTIGGNYALRVTEVVKEDSDDE